MVFLIIVCCIYWCRPSTETNRNLTTSELYMIDSGGQYFEGTTDITRSVHFGTPTDKQKVSTSFNT